MNTEITFESELAYAEVGTADDMDGMVRLYAEDRCDGGGLVSMRLTPTEALELAQTLTRAAIAALAA